MNIGMIQDGGIPPDPRVENEASLLTKYHDVFVLTTKDKNNTSSFEIYKKATISRINLSQFVKNKFRPLIGTILDLYSLLWKRSIVEFINKFDIDILHVHDLYMGKAAIYANKKFNLPLIIDLHENYPEQLKYYNWANRPLSKLIVRTERWKKLEQQILQKVNATIVLSNNFKNELLNQYPFLNRMIIFPNVPNLKQFKNYKINDVYDDKEDFILLYFGVIAERRGILTCLEAQKRLAKIIPNIKLLLIGPVDKDDQQKFEEYLNHPALSDNVEHINWIDISELPSYLNISDVCLSPLIKNEQHDSGIANKVYQYMLYECPLLVSNCIPQEELVNNEDCGVVFESQNVKDYIAKITTLYNSPQRRALMGEKGKKAITDKYNIQKQGEKLVTLYNSLALKEKNVA